MGSEQVECICSCSTHLAYDVQYHGNPEFPRNIRPGLQVLRRLDTAESPKTMIFQDGSRDFGFASENN